MVLSVEQTSSYHEDARGLKRKQAYHHHLTFIILAMPTMTNETHEKLSWAYSCVQFSAR